MKILGIEIRRVPPKEPEPLEALAEACDLMNEAWERCLESHSREVRATRPWILWDEKRVVLSRLGGERQVVHE